MKPEELDELAQRLFRAARGEAPSPEARSAARARALASTRNQRRSRGVVLAGWGALAASVAVGLWHFSARPPSPVVSAEALRPSPPPSPSSHLRQPATVSSEARNGEPPAPVAPVRSGRPTQPRPAATLGDEIAWLKRARAELDSGNARGALAELDRYARDVPGARLGDEATVLRLEALARSGRGPEAARLAREFVAKNPGSPLVDRARTFVPDAATSTPEPIQGGEP
jgi:hypothetical protein